jgi:dTDP-4-amino-4,6-dideoxygalactose transaminase
MVARQGFSLPMHVEMELRDVERVCDALSDAVGALSR